MRAPSVAVIGAGPAGLGFLTTLTDASDRFAIDVFDKGPSLPERLARDRATERTALTSGFGGAGLFSDGKFCLSLDVGGKLDTLPADERRRLESAADALFARFLPVPITHSVATHALLPRLEQYGLAYTSYPVRHYGTDQLRELNQHLLAHLTTKAAFHYHADVVSLHPTNGQTTLVIREGGAERTAAYDYVILAPGKGGARWLAHQAQALAWSYEPQKIRVGVRVEAPRTALTDLAAIAADPKIYRYTDGLKTKVHCFCDGGELLALDYEGARLLGSHSTTARKTDWTIFGVLTEVRPHPQQDTTAFAQELLAPFDRRRIVRESLDAFLRGQGDGAAYGGTLDPTLHEPGRIASYLPRDATARIRDFLHRMSAACNVPLAAASVFAPAMEWWQDSLLVHPRTMETPTRGVYAIGDGSGWSQGIIHAAATGIQAATDILCKQSHRE